MSEVRERTVKTFKGDSYEVKSSVKWQMTRYEATWRFFFFVIVLLGAYLVSKIIVFYTAPELAHVPKGSVYDFWVSCLVALCIALIRYLMRMKFQQKILFMIAEHRIKSPEDGKRRADQLCKWAFDIVYYTCSTICAYLIVKDQKFLPPSLGGPCNGNCANIYEGYPFVPDVPYIRLFYLIQCGAHLYTFIHYITCKIHDPKFYEYALHHGLALFLIIFSYLMNFHVVGVLVLLVHDPCDVLLIASRGYVELKCRKLWINIIIYVMTYTGWVYLRNIQFPYCIIVNSFHFLIDFFYSPYADLIYTAVAYYVFMLVVLAAMYMYWTVFLTQASISMFWKGTDKNSYDKH